MPMLRKEKSQATSLLYHKELGKEEQTKPNVSRKKEIIKIGAEMNEIETRLTIGKKINKTKS